MSYFKQELIENPSLIVNIELNKDEHFALGIMFDNEEDMKNFIKKELGSSLEWIRYCADAVKGNIKYYNQLKNNLIRYNKDASEDSYDYESLLYEYEGSMKRAYEKLFGEGSYDDKKNQIEEDPAVFKQVMKVVEAEIIFFIAKWKQEYVLAYEEFNRQKQEFDKFEHPDSIVF